VALTGCHLAAGLDDLDPPAAAPVSLSWLNRYGGPRTQRVEALAIDSRGDILVAGYFDGVGLDLGGDPLPNVGHSDVFVAKLAPDGQHVWSRSFGDASAIRVADISVGNSGEVTLTGRLRGSVDFDGRVLTAGVMHDSVYAVRLDASGEVLWAWQSELVAEGESRPQAIANLGDDAVIVGVVEEEMIAGDLRITSGEDDFDLFVLVLDRHGAPEWLAGYGGDGHQQPEDVVADGDEIVVAGTTYGAIEFPGGVVDPGGEMDADPFIVRLRTTKGHEGEFVWGEAIGDGEPNCFEWCEQALARTPGHTVFHAGAYSGGLAMGSGAARRALQGQIGGDVFVYAIEPSGLAGKPAPRWASSFGDGGEQRAHDLDALGEGVVVAGLFKSALDFGGGPLENDDLTSDVFLAAFDREGTLVASVPLPIDGDDDSRYRPRIAVSPLGGVVVAGAFRGTLRFGDASWVADDADAFVLLLDGPGLVP
jgi:8-oxo-dGTP pyrophosphatase MutT (NUDIX family)